LTATAMLCRLVQQVRQKAQQGRLEPAKIGIQVYEKQDTFGLPLHGEMYYVDHRPVILWFYCVTPADSDGETTICDGSKVYEALSDPTKKLLQEKRLKYIRRYLDGEWQLIYQTDNIDDAASFAGWNGLQVHIDRDSNSIHTEYVHPAVITSKWGNHKVYINNVLTVWWQEEHLGRETSIVRFEDGSKISKDIIDEVVAAQNKFVIPIAWHPQDFVVIDNTRTLHGRRAFTDTNREVYLRMVQSVDFGCSKSSTKSTSSISRHIVIKYGLKLYTFTNKGSNGGWSRSLRRC